MSNPKGAGTTQPITLLVVDDHAILRDSLCKLLALEPDLAVVGQAANGPQAIAQAAKLQPAIILLDLHMAGMNGLEAAGHILAQPANRSRVVLLTADDSPDYRAQAQALGIAAYCPKQIETEALLSVIRTVAGLQPMATQSSNPSNLSQREMQVLQAVAVGLSNKAIALQLGISHQTVRNHMTSIMDKLHLQGRTQVALHAVRQGWVKNQVKQDGEESQP
jgi:DNA-binding NarL/FixJ family response regulator